MIICAPILGVPSVSRSVWVWYLGCWYVAADNPLGCPRCHLPRRAMSAVAVKRVATIRKVALPTALSDQHESLADRSRTATAPSLSRVGDRSFGSSLLSIFHFRR